MYPKILFPRKEIEMDRLQRAQRLHQRLLDLPLGFGGDSRFDKLVGPDPLRAADKEVVKLTRQALILKSYLTKGLALYRCGLTDSNWSWVAALVDGKASPAEVAISHQCALFENRTAVLVRADQPDFGVSVELQIPGSGWGFMEAINSLMREDSGSKSLGIGFSQGFIEAMVEIAGHERVRILHASNESRYTQERAWFAQYCSTLSLGRVAVNLSQPWTLDLAGVDVVRRCFLNDLVKFAGVKNLFDLYFTGKIKIEPPPCLLYDQKVLVILPFEPRSREFFTDEERALFPEAYLIRPDFIPEIEGEKLESWKDLARLSGSARQWVLKYAGSDSRRRGGAAEVWSLDSKNSSRADVVSLMMRALMDWETGDPWIIQRKVKRKFPITYLGLDGALHDDEMYARITPMYNLGDDPRLIGVTANLRRMWKVHGQKAREDDPNVLLAVHGKEE